MENKMEPKIGTNAYLLSVVNPFRRPMCFRYVSENVVKIFAIGYLLFFAILSWLTRGNGLLGVGVSFGLSFMLVAVIVFHIEAMMRLHAVKNNFLALVDNWKS
jgi:hypothetical protein